VVVIIISRQETKRFPQKKFPNPKKRTKNKLPMIICDRSMSILLNNSIRENKEITKTKLAMLFQLLFESQLNNILDKTPLKQVIFYPFPSPKSRKTNIIVRECLTKETYSSLSYDSSLLLNLK